MSDPDRRSKLRDRLVVMWHDGWVGAAMILLPLLGLAALWVSWYDPEK